MASNWRRYGEKASGIHGPDYERLRRPRAKWILDRSLSFGRLAQMTSPVGRWFRDWAVRLTPASVNERALRRIVTDMPGVPLPSEEHT